MSFAFALKVFTSVDTAALLTSEGWGFDIFSKLGSYKAAQ
jgi:hypothetical protein